MYNCNVQSIKTTGTHIIQNVRVTSTIHPGQLVVYADFIQTISITSLGYMAIVYSSELDIHYNVAHRQYGQSNADVKFSGLPGDAYKVSLFNIEPDGVPSTNSASLSRNISIIGMHKIELWWLIPATFFNPNSNLNFQFHLIPFYGFTSILLPFRDKLIPFQFHCKCSLSFYLVCSQFYIRSRQYMCITVTMLIVM